MTNSEFAQRSIEFIEKTACANSNRLYGLMKPRFVECDAEKMSLTVCFPSQGWELNAAGNIHGGITAAMIDSAMGSLTHILTGALTPTIQMSISFLRGGPASGDITVRVWVTKLGRSVIYLSGEAWPDDRQDDLIAVSDGTYRSFNG